jgi:predicted DNA-binding transcriptional regulator AlpA
MKNKNMYINVRAVADRYQISVATVWRWSQNEQLPKPVKLNGSTRWRMDDILRWEEQQNSVNQYP